MPKLSFEHVDVRYPTDKEGPEGLLALDDLTLSIDAGESVAVIGPSGCGKSSTLRLAAGLLHPTCGEVLIDGKLVDEPRSSTALILQDYGLLPWKTVLENAALGLKVRGIAKAERNARAQDALRVVELDGFEHQFPGDLSGGMKQRLALARSLALDVDLLLMDEPLSALDALMREQLQDVLLNLWQQEGYMQLLVTHSIEEAVFLGQRIVVMSARPGHVVSVKENPSMGDVGYRESPEFFELCTELRELLHDSGARSQGGANDA